ncbi:acetyl-CoA carboxylase biotin carboxyl carrier protein [Gemmata sp. G18]|uniref:Biotin carboxyl carrier protein of acetyl-CoA carboxylase n=1 Tax=Gemmata palustris TaxID=2822762 RepID=A0ABS5BYD9_9BACT|nr:acetyl-CoA carboxylase biotin carboxyl carrier protein [Gemmata palustris]
MVADDKRDAPRPFDVKTVEYLLKLMTEHDLGEVDLTEGEQRIRLRKRAAMVAPPVAYAPAPVAPVAPAVAYAPAPSAPAAAPAGTAAPAPSAASKNYLEIKSPMVGTFYIKPDPKKPDFVTVGAKVNAKTVVCTIEAMKTYNPVTADCAGTIAEICVQGGDFVEYGTVLFRVDPS